MAITRLSGTNAISGALPAANINNTSIGNVTALPAGVGGSLVLIKTQVASGVSSVIFDNGSNGVVFDNTYDQYIFKLTNVRSTVNTDIRVKVRTSAGDYNGAYRATGRVSGYNGGGLDVFDGFTSGMFAYTPSDVRYEFAEYLSGDITVKGAGYSTRPMCWFQFSYKDSSGYQKHFAASGGADGDMIMTGINFYPNSGNMSGTFSLYGVSK